MFLLSRLKNKITVTDLFTPLKHIFQMRLISQFGICTYTTHNSINGDLRGKSKTCTEPYEHESKSYLTLTFSYLPSDHNNLYSMSEVIVFKVIFYLEPERTIDEKYLC